MAASAATAAILVLFDSAVASTIVLVFAFEITRMTGSTEGRVLVRGRWIYEWSSHHIAVARATAG